MNPESITSTATSTMSGSQFFAPAVDHPLLTITDAASFRVFLRAYDQYATEVKERGKQLVSIDTVSSHVVEPVQLKFCVNVEWLKSLIALWFIPDVTSYKFLTDIVLRKFLESKTEKSKNLISSNAVDEIVGKDLCITRKDSNAQSRMENLLISYHSLLCRHGLKGIISENQKVAVFHILSAIRPLSL